MSFSGTPLGQGRRLDHNTFLNKPPSNGHRATSPHKILPPTSYSYGAPVSQPTSPQRDRTNTTTTAHDDEESALLRFARLKREQALANLPGAPKITTSPLDPTKWSVKGTTVNVANVISAAAEMHNPNDSWASGSTRPIVAPRSTSVEYENQVGHVNLHKRLPAPNRAGQRAGPQRKPPSKAGSSRSLVVPDSEAEEDRPVNGRGKSPFDMVVDSAKRLKATASFYMQQKSTTEPGEPSAENDSSYGYENEEREFHNLQQQNTSARRPNNATHKRGRMSMDNKAYKPTQSEEEETDSDFEEDGRTRRRGKNKKDATGGPLTNLPVISADKRKKARKAKGSKANLGEGGEEAAESGSDDQTTERQSQSAQRASIPRNSEPPRRQPSVPRGSIPRELPSHDEPDTSMDIEQGLDSIPEVDENELHDTHHNQRQRRSVSRPPSSPSRIGGPLGHLVNLALRTIARLLGLFLTVLSGLLYFCGQLLGTIFDIIFLRPFNWASRAGGAAVLMKYVVLGLIVSAVYMLRDPLMQYIPTIGHTPVYRAPDAPPTDIADLAARLQRIENVISGLSQDVERGRVRTENEAKAQLDLAGRLGELENRVVMEGRRAVEAETQARNAAKEGLGAVRHEVEVLQAQIQATQQQQQQQQQQSSRSEAAASDEEARAKVRALEERMGSMEGGVKEALELGKKALSSQGKVGPGAAWWNKLASGGATGSELTIKSSDGQDVTGLIKHLVDSSVSMYSKDTLARPDFALHSGGARVIPSLTSPTFEMRPANLRGQLLGLITGNGYAIGRPPITALHHEQHQGHCWPFAGQTGQLGVALAAPTYISDISIDHVAKEVAFDMRSAPREMEVWGMVEGKDNVAKVREWMRERRERREQARERGEEVEEEPEYPNTLPRAPQYVRIANFTYDIHSPRNVQTFPVDKEVQALGADFGIVVLMVKSNWGRDEYTCLYRLRVHGQQMGEVPLPHPSQEEAA
ncbi:putative sad1 / UNC-like C-terminal [Lyophyllum shimeji]|uniref:Sad1 / UNC-like C-terminal n=1 Tax=Lyophyllum shimeji TaxID=47721 RepID=A0A9P3PRT6_LYOSH|nr:putative sad1 / UNC-like C-terminal [Lyophyllum shimeji]